MSTAGKTTDSTRLKLKMAQEQIEDLQLALRSAKNPAATNEKVVLSSDEIHNILFPHGSGTEDMEMESNEPTEAQAIGTVINRQKAAIYPNADAMEDQDHSIIGIGSDPPSSDTETSDPTSSSSSSSESSSSSSEGSHDTAELVQRLSNNQYHAISKSMTKNERLPSSNSDTESLQSVGQDSGSATGHSPADPSGPASIVLDDAGRGD
jgi:hypothetical protein